MSTSPPDASLTSLLSTALEQLSGVVRTEVKLAQAEMTQKAVAAGVGAGMVAAAGLMAIPALVLLLMAVASFLVRLGLSDGVANLLASVLGFAVCAGLATAGIGRLRAQALVPERAVEQIRRDTAAIKDHIA